MEPQPLPSDDDGLLALAGLSDPPAPDEGLFREGCWLRRVSAESVLLFGGGRALLLEVAHPLVAAGVAEHSNFRAEPFGRLQRTLEAMSAITFQGQPAALAAARSVERAHDRVRGRLARAVGPFAAGTSYSGRDPELMRWVWATLVDTALVVYQRFVARLDDASLAAYYADQCVVARVLGIPAVLVPPTWSEFHDYFEGVVASDVLTVTPNAREIGEVVLNPPGGAVGGSRIRLVTAGLLPARLRDAFGLTWDAESAARLEALTASVRALRSARPPLDGDREAR
jgi:uncharacterized protein (DUF2236 family)